MRLEKTIKIQDVDRELTFKIRQFDAWSGLMWGERAAIALGKAPNFFALMVGGNGESSDEDELTRQAAAIITALCSGVNFEEIEPLQRELLGCCFRLVDGVEQMCTPSTISGFVDSPYTLYQLLMEAFKLNISFFQNASRLNSASALQDFALNKKAGQSPIRMSTGSSAQ